MTFLPLIERSAPRRFSYALLRWCFRCFDYCHWYAALLLRRHYASIFFEVIFFFAAAAIPFHHADASILHTPLSSLPDAFFFFFSAHYFLPPLLPRYFLFFRSMLAFPPAAADASPYFSFAAFFCLLLFRRLRYAVIDASILFRRLRHYIVGHESAYHYWLRDTLPLRLSAVIFATPWISWLLHLLIHYAAYCHAIAYGHFDTIRRHAAAITEMLHIIGYQILSLILFTPLHWHTDIRLHDTATPRHYDAITPLRFTLHCRYYYAITRQRLLPPLLITPLHYWYYWYYYVDSRDADIIIAGREKSE